MTEENQPVINPNQADVETLMKLPSVGSNMAQRIVAARPFTSVDDLQRVNGIGPALLERWKPRITLSEFSEPLEKTPGTAPQLEPEAEEELPVASPLPPSGGNQKGGPPEAEEELARESPLPPSGGNQKGGSPEAEEDLPVASPLPPSGGNQKGGPSEAEEDLPVASPLPPSGGNQMGGAHEHPGLVSRTRAFWMAFGIGMLAFILALLLSLSILANLNEGSLQFVRPSQLNQLTREMDGLTTRIDALDQSMDGLRTRLDNLEALSNSITAVEKDVEQLQSDVDTATGQVGALDQGLGELSTQVETLQAQGAQLQEFLNGLRDLMDNLFPAEGEQ